MKPNGITLTAAVFLLMSASMASRLDSSPASQEPEFVRVAVRFAKVRRLPDPGAKAIKEIGYGTILKVLETSGDFHRVAPLGVDRTVEPWYVLRGEVERASLEAPRAVVETRRVTFSPSDPAPGRQLLFTASGFLTPNLLKWDMGDGTVLTTGGRSFSGGEATLAYVYSSPGKYTVKVFDKGGGDGLPPVLALVTVAVRTEEIPLKTSEKPLQAERAKDPPREVGERPLQPDRTQDPPLEISEKSHPAARTAIAIPVGTGNAPPAPAAVSAVPARKARSKYPFFKVGPYGGFYRPTNALFKEIYGEGDVLYGGCLGLRIWKGFYLWLSLAQFKSIGGTTFTEDKTTLTLIPASAFLRFEVGQGAIIPYAGVGYTFLSFEEESESVGGHNKDSGGDLALEAGFEFKINRHVYIDLGARFTRIQFATENPVNPDEMLDLGGLQAGISLLISF